MNWKHEFHLTTVQNDFQPHIIAFRFKKFTIAGAKAYKMSILLNKFINFTFKILGNLKLY